jgi:hypothetical protein
VVVLVMVVMIMMMMIDDDDGGDKCIDKAYVTMRSSTVSSAHAFTGLGALPSRVSRRGKGWLSTISGRRAPLPFPPFPPCP